MIARIVPRALAMAVTVALGTSCADLQKQLYIASDTSIGVNGALNTAQTAGKIAIGYDRKFVGLIPKKDLHGSSDVMSAFNCSLVEIDGLRITKFYEHLASGQAAAALVAGMKPTDRGAECVTSP